LKACDRVGIHSAFFLLTWEDFLEMVKVVDRERKRRADKIA
jgi:hypothetical protein